MARLTFRRGIKGRLVVILVNGKSELPRAEEAVALLNQAHAVLERCDGAMLALMMMMMFIIVPRPQTAFIQSHFPIGLEPSRALGTSA